jgi:hypothetical protein
LVDFHGSKAGPCGIMLRKKTRSSRSWSMLLLLRCSGVLALRAEFARLSDSPEPDFYKAT